MMGFSMNEPIEAESAGMPVTVMAISDHGVDAYGLMIVSNPELIAKNPALVKGFLKATARGLSDAAKDPAAAVAAVNKAVSESDPARETKVLDRTLRISRATTRKRTAPVGKARAVGSIRSRSQKGWVS